ncbi:unannotated protein [freshwater metagenome]|uniref:Unannotated protein n=1 Tax=freshwater metagenome TaxID=449393 RepID=A0A6J6I4G1_9ZZZZ
MANPFVTTIFAADPSAHVFNNRVYVYVSYEEPGTNTYDSMQSYHCISSDDLQNWVDHGRILSLKDVDWAISHMWAIDGNYWQGKYYLVYCAIDKETSTFKTGLGVSDRPEGPFKDQGTISGVEWGQDPSLYVWNETPYLVWGGRGAILIAELNQDLKSVKPETIRDLSVDINGYEGPFLHEREGKFYLTYPALENEQWPQRMSFATAETPLGPYKYGGVFIPEYEGNSGTIHGSIIEFKGEWYSFYHSGFISGTATNRSLMLDRIQHDAEGNIIPFMPNREGAFAGKGSTVVILDAAAAPRASGKLHGTKIATDNSDYTGHGYVTGLVQQEYGVSVLVDNGLEQEYEIFIRYRSEAQRVSRVVAGKQLFYDGNQNQDYDQYINRGTVFPASASWQELSVGRIVLKPGEHEIRISNSHNLPDGENGIEIDYVKLVPLFG